MNSRVERPKHYTSHPSGVECIQITEHYNFTIGNAIKYLWRNGLKDEASLDPVEKQIEDLKKAIWYINREISNLQQGVYNGTKEQNENVAQDGGTRKSASWRKTSRTEVQKLVYAVTPNSAFVCPWTAYARTNIRCL